MIDKTFFIHQVLEMLDRSFYCINKQISTRSKYIYFAILQARDSGILSHNLSIETIGF